MSEVLANPHDAFDPLEAPKLPNIIDSIAANTMSTDILTMYAVSFMYTPLSMISAMRVGISTSMATSPIM